MRARFLPVLLVALAHSVLTTPAIAQSDLAIESLPPAQQELARNLWRELRCVVCQGQSVAESRAPLAADMRNLVVTRLQAGDSPEVIRRYLADHYGTQILLKPPVRPLTWPLWFAPLLFLAFGAAIILRTNRRRPA